MWSSLVSYEAKEFARIVRESLERLQYVFMRDTTSKSYSRFVVMIPMMGGAHVFRYTVEYPAKFVVQCYDTYPGTKAGLMPIFEIENMHEGNRQDIRKLLDEIVSKLERPPWEFTTGQKLMVGFLLPEFGRAKKAWAEFGFNTSRKSARERKRKLRERKQERVRKRRMEISQVGKDQQPGIDGQTNGDEAKGIEEGNGNKGSENKVDGKSGFSEENRSALDDRIDENGEESAIMEKGRDEG